MTSSQDDLSSPLEKETGEKDVHPEEEEARRGQEAGADSAEAGGTETDGTEAEGV
ncbi:hypothetical protein [Streptomyces galbus]|uniref:hypothetical protein n=1 Tax=Streptomyces galbus TaxID=33898 RepID=UPI00144AB311|nr:hypothetical protein [Streptomyces galbus]GHD42048.1 hypothetical protein GCM10010335_44470 [Streptomyces galbus]